MVNLCEPKPIPQEFVSSPGGFESNRAHRGDMSHFDCMIVVSWISFDFISFEFRLYIWIFFQDVLGGEDWKAMVPG